MIFLFTSRRLVDVVDFFVLDRPACGFYSKFGTLHMTILDDIRMYACKIGNFNQGNCINSCLTSVYVFYLPYILLPFYFTLYDIGDQFTLVKIRYIYDLQVFVKFKSY